MLTLSQKLKVLSSLGLIFSAPTLSPGIKVSDDSWQSIGGKRIILLKGIYHWHRASPVAQRVRNPPAMQETQEMRVWSLGQEDPLEKGMATHSSILAWKIPWTEELGRLQSKGSQRVRRDWVTKPMHAGAKFVQIQSLAWFQIHTVARPFGNRWVSCPRHLDFSPVWAPSVHSICYPTYRQCWFGWSVWFLCFLDMSDYLSLLSPQEM